MGHLLRAGFLLLAGVVFTYGLSTWLQMNAERQAHASAYEAPYQAPVAGGSFYEKSADKQPGVAGARTDKTRQVGL
ncbi:MAG: hypothetical protein JOY81_04280 [Alphaproteobacteria bacterium]|nr:hypothetical protein [Alphaproteobacteria bacterium]